MVIQAETTIKENQLKAVNKVVDIVYANYCLEDAYLDLCKMALYPLFSNMKIGRGGSHIWVTNAENNEQILIITE